MINQSENLSNGFENVEAFLRSSADFEPTANPTEDFIKVALRSQLPCFKSTRKMWLAASATACLGIICGASTIRGIIYREPQLPKPTFNITQNENDKSIIGQATEPPKSEIVRTIPQVQIDKDLHGDEVQPVTYTRQRTNRVRSAEPRAINWQNESVDRYASGVISPVWREVKEENSGSTRLEQAMLTEPLEVGEKTHQNGSSSEGMFSLVSYEGGH